MSFSSPIGRDNGLKIREVWVRIPSGAPKTGIAKGIRGFKSLNLFSFHVAKRNRRLTARTDGQYAEVV